MPLDLKEQLERDIQRLNNLRDNASSWRATVREIAEFVRPRQSRFMTTSGRDYQDNDGSKLDSKVINSSTTDASDVLAAGLYSGLSSPSTPWFELIIDDEELNRFGPVKEWLTNVRDIMLKAMSRSNQYESMHSMFAHLGDYGTAAALMDEDFVSAVRFRPYIFGEFLLGQDHTRRVNAIFSYYSMSAEQVVQAYGIDNVSNSVKTAFERKNQDERFEIIHIIEPNYDIMYGFDTPKGMEYSSRHFELGTNDGKYAKISGYRSKPFIAPRWRVYGMDTYGDSCGSKARGDIKMLQKLEEKKLKALDKAIDPPMNAPLSLKGQGASLLPGAVNYMDVPSGQQGFSPAYLIRPELESAENSIMRVEARIRRSYFNDLFTTITQTEKKMTAYEVARRHEEKLVLIGPTLQNLYTEMLDPIVDRWFNVLDSFGAFPEPPEELNGVEFKVQYISILAQAQRLTRIAPIEQAVGFAGTLTPVFPDIMDNFDADTIAREYTDLVGAAPRILRDPQMMQQMRQAKAEAAARQQAAENMERAAKGAKDLGGVQMDTNSALDRTMQTMNEAAGE